MHDRFLVYRELQKKQEQRTQMHRDIQMTQAAKDAWKEKQKKLVILEQKALQEQQMAAEKRKANLWGIIYLSQNE